MFSGAKHNVPNLRWVYLACIVLGGILTHFASEFAAMGSDADAIALSRRHAYLALAALACAMFAFVELRQLIRGSSGFRDLRRRLSLSLDSLPMNGRWSFYILTAIAQFSVGIASAVGEGCFFCGHDVIAGVAGALLTGVALAVIMRALTARLPRLAASFVALLPAVEGSEASLTRRPRIDIVFAPRFVWSTQLFNRPPPSLQF